MNQLTQISEIYLLGIFLINLMTTFLLIPRIRNTTLKLGYTDTPDARSSHQNTVPTFGGIAFYISLILTLFMLQNEYDNAIIITLLVSISILFFTGFKDDLRNSSPKAKLFGQLLAVSLLMLHSEFYISSLHGFLGIHEMPPIIGIPFSVFLFISIINAYNLIDGIDGLASIVGIVAASSFAVLFYNLDLYFYTGICVALISMLFAFLRFNFSTKKKIFMGDTGSLTIGFVLGILGMRLMTLDFETVSLIGIPRSGIPLLFLTILIVPTFDVSRVIFIRLIKKLSISTPDRNHIHHLLIDSGLSHKKASSLLGLVNISLVGLMYFSIKLVGLYISISFLAIVLLIFIYIFFIMNRRFDAIRVRIKLRNKLSRFLRFFTS
ncbi:MAG: MraY family glycosyltransferase [Polaribacter sp.]|nr:MraY family glycosyltransferase [Polaribacter sp.]